MRVYQLLAVAALVAPAIALAQVGPNPAVNGSLDPTVGNGTDAATAPDDVGVGVHAGDAPMSDPANPTDAADAADPVDATGNSTAAAPMNPPAAAAKKTTAPTSESARKPR